MTDYQTPALLKQSIKYAIANALKGQTAAGNLVFVSRSLPTEAEDQPAIVLVYAQNEQVELFDRSPKRYKRVLTVRIECIFEGDNDDDLELRLETAGDAVEKVLETDLTLGGLVSDVNLTATDYQSSAEAQVITGLLALTYDIEFFTYENFTDGTNLSDFTGADVKYQIQGSAAQQSGNPAEIDAADTINES